jgi:DNA-binding CsgD family transcriptional regulator
VELAHTLGDAELLKRTLYDEVLEYAFRSQEPQRIGPIVSAYAKVAIDRGQMHRAKRLIARGIAAINQADHVGDLLALAARYGSSTDATHARNLLVERIRLPNHRVAHAYLELWEAQKAVRSRARVEAKVHADQAAHLFARLGWRHQQADALALAGMTRSEIRRDATSQRPTILSEFTPVLTGREQQVAELVLRGLTNRTIAKMLSISEHTVESHMTSILNRLGLRSRWQLLDLSR